MTYVVTGAAGLVGGNLVRLLSKQGNHVRALIHKDQKSITGLDVEKIPADLKDLNTLKSAFMGAKTVFHSAGMVSILSSDWEQLYEINVLGTRNVVEACLSANVQRLVYFSSIHALVQEPLNKVLDESRPLVTSKLASPYAKSKAAAEKEIRDGISHGLNAIILNPTAIIGPYDYRPSYTGDVLIKLAKGRIPALVNGGFDWVDVRDVAEAALEADQVAPAGAQYIISGHWASVIELATLCQEITGVKPPWFLCPMWLAKFGAPFFSALYIMSGIRPLYTMVSLDSLNSNKHISHTHATQELDYHPRPLKETLWDTYAWFKASGIFPKLTLADRSNASLDHPLR